MTAYEPTPSQRRVLEAARGFIEQHGYSPSFRDLAGQLGCSLNNVRNHLHSLRKRGLVDLDEATARSLRLRLPDVEDGTL